MKNTFETFPNNNQDNPNPLSTFKHQRGNRLNSNLINVKEKQKVIIIFNACSLSLESTSML
jgi:hypothetical protein